MTQINILLYFITCLKYVQKIKRLTSNDVSHPMQDGAAIGIGF